MRFYIKVLCGLHKSVFLSIRYCGLKGLCLPIVVTRRTQISAAKGKVLFKDPLKFGLIRLGFCGVALSSYHQWNVWNVFGKIEVSGRAEFGVGTRIYVGPSGHLSIGDKVLITAQSDLICCHRVIIGNNVLISWDVLIMDTDSHPIRNRSEKVINPDRPVVIGDNVWIGCRAVLTKGATIKANSVIAAGTLAHKKYAKENVLIGGFPGTIIMSEIVWKREHFPS